MIALTYVKKCIFILSVLMDKFSTWKISANILISKHCGRTIFIYLNTGIFVYKHDRCIQENHALREERK